MRITGGRRPLGPDVGGFTVLEALVALLLGVLLLALTLTTLSEQRRVQASLSRRADVLATVRTARHVLGRELRSLCAGVDPVAVAEDSLGLRLFRGGGPVCPSRPRPTSLWVSPDGTRAPDPAKDSVLVVPSSGPPVALGLVSRDPAPGACAVAPEFAWERWALAGPLPPDPVYVRYFERSAYHLEGGALRLRSGAAGRQPLTPQTLDDAASGFRATPGGVRVRLVPSSGPRAPWDFFLPVGNPIG